MKYEYWFANIKGLGNKKKRQLRERVECAEELYHIEETACKALGIEEKEYETMQNSKQDWDLEEKFEQLQKKQVRFVTIFDKEYPKRLKEISSPPYVLYVKGKLPDPHKYSVAIVGARECTSYGKTMARIFGEKLAAAGVQVISGMAKGVDGAGQIGAVYAGGASYAVLGSGVDVCYPAEHIELYAHLQQCGGILSEQPLGEKPLPQYFPARNRLISGLVDAVLVMEAKEKSGSLITADMALEQGKDVYALPGAVDSVLSRGCNQLIKQGAGILLSPEDLLKELSVPEEQNEKKIVENKIALESDEKLVYSCLGLYPKNLEELAKTTNFSIPTLINSLVSLELNGYAKEISKNYYIKIK